MSKFLFDSYELSSVSKHKNKHSCNMLQPFWSFAVCLNTFGSAAQALGS